MDISQLHTPVMLERTLELLVPALSTPGAVLLDCTLGMGGHSEAVFARLDDVRVVGVDRDAEALELARRRLAAYSERLTTVNTEYDDLDTILSRAGVSAFEAILLDLGVSSLQLDRAERGFSYAKDAPLDMRMDATAPVTAYDVLNEYDVAELTRIFWQYANEKLAKRYAQAIVAERQRAPLTTTGQLADIIAQATPRAVARPGHPAKRVFQALRIEVNEELAMLGRALPRLLDALAPGGRAVALAYHSLEDRIVKREFTDRTTSSTPMDLPVEMPQHQPHFRLLTRGAEKASTLEQQSNSRAKPVRLRAVERLKVA